MLYREILSVLFCENKRNTPIKRV